MLLGQLLVYRFAFADVGTNMASYRSPENYLGDVQTRYISLLMVIFYAMHDKRRTEVK